MMIIRNKCEQWESTSSSPRHLEHMYRNGINAARIKRALTLQGFTSFSRLSPSCSSLFLHYPRHPLTSACCIKPQPVEHCFPLLPACLLVTTKRRCPTGRKPPRRSLSRHATRRIHGGHGCRRPYDRWKKSSPYVSEIDTCDGGHGRASAP